jgi:hypothetical protein
MDKSRVIIGLWSLGQIFSRAAGLANLFALPSYDNVLHINHVLGCGNIDLSLCHPQDFTITSAIHPFTSTFTQLHYEGLLINNQLRLSLE